LFLRGWWFHSVFSFLVSSQIIFVFPQIVFWVKFLWATCVAQSFLLNLFWSISFGQLLLSIWCRLSRLRLVQGGRGRPPLRDLIFPKLVTKVIACLRRLNSASGAAFGEVKILLAE
jgi:hypothetical protein